MKAFSLSSLLLVFALLLGGPAVAKESYNYTVAIVKCSKAPGKRILSKQQWNGFLKNNSGVVLDSMEGVTEEGAYSLVFEGLKNPIPYKDPRAGMYQVQYTDVGLKIDISVKPQKDGTLFVESRTERAVASPVQESPERTSVFIYENGSTMKRGQTSVVASSKGVMNVKYMKNHFPDVTVTESDYLMMVVTVE